MTDRETLEVLLNRAGVVFTSGTYNGDQNLPTLIIEAGGSPANRGYTGFYTEFVFNSEGRLTSMGAWE